jgi:hypothetical protein
MKVVIMPDRTHNPFDEIYRVSRLRENLTSGSEGEGLETGLRSTLNGHAGGNPGHSQGYSYGLPRQSFTRQNEGFNTQKNLGYALQHKYARLNWQAAKNFRVEPPVTQTAPPQTRASAIHAPGSSSYGFAT